MKILLKIIVVLAFYFFGQFFYSTVFSLTLKIMRLFSGNQLKFFGTIWEVPGNPMYGLLLILFPLLGFLATGIIRLRDAQLRSDFWAAQFITTAFIYVTVCLIYSRYLLAQINSGVLNAENYLLDLHQVNPYFIALVSIISGSIFAMFFSWLLQRKTKGRNVSRIPQLN